MRYENLSLGHKSVLYERLRAIDIPVSEYSFSNLYLFREKHGYEVAFDKEIFIKGRTYDGFTYLMPTADIRNIDTDYLLHLSEGVDFLFPVPGEWLFSFSQAECNIEYRQEDSDYIYTISKMALYGGSKLHKKRNLLKQFVSLYEHRALPLTAERIEDAKDILAAWQDESAVPPEETDYSQCLEALDRSEELIICGGIYYAQNEPAGFIIGEELNSELFAIHFAKARKKFKGIYQYMYNNFANILPGRYRYLNFEQDMGKPALRAAKASYLPDIMLRKYRVSTK